MANSIVQYGVMDPDTDQQGWKSVRTLDGVWITTLARPEGHDPSPSVRKSTKEFTFIDGSTSPRSRQKSRRLAKSHARKWAYMDQKRTRENHDRPSESLPNTATSSASAWPITRKEPVDQILQPSSPLCVFGPLPFQANTKYHKYIQIVAESPATAYASESAVHFSAGKRECVRLSLSDDCAFYMACWGAAAFEAQLLGKSSTESDQLLNIALGLLRPRLNTSEVPSEPLISTVATVCAAQIAFNDREKWSLHLQGLSTLLQMRGGLTSLNPALQINVSRADIMGAVYWLVEPRLPPPTRPAPVLPHLFRETYTYSYQEAFVHLLSTAPLTVELRAVLLDLWRLNAAIDYAFNDVHGRVKLDGHILEGEITFLEHQLLKMPQVILSPLQRAVRVAALFYVECFLLTGIYAAFRGTALMRELQDSLRSVEGDNMNYHANFSLHVWLYVIGTLMAPDRETYSWFVQRLTRLSRSCFSRVPTLQKIHYALRQMLWTEWLHGARLRESFKKFNSIDRDTVQSPVLGRS